MIMPHEHSDSQDYWQKVEEERRKYQWHQQSTPASTPDRSRSSTYERLDPGSQGSPPSYNYAPSYPPPPPVPTNPHGGGYPDHHQRQHPGYWSHHQLHQNQESPYDPQYAHHHFTHSHHQAPPPPPAYMYPPQPPYQHPHHRPSQHPHQHQMGSYPPPTSLPDDETSSPPGVVYLQHHQQRRGKSDQDDIVYEVQDTDVLCGRGAPTNFHPGNQYFRTLVTEQQMAYLAARRVDKPEIALLIVEKVKERGGRFLKRTKRPGLGPSGHFCWQEISGERSYEKTCQSLREGAPELRKRMAIKQLSAVSVDDSDGRDEENAEENQKREAS